MLKKMVFLLAVVCAMGANLFAQEVQAQARGRFDSKSTVTVTIDGLTCDNSQGTFQATSWSFGVSTPTTTGGTGGGAGRGKATLTDLSVKRKADGCTPKLFGASVMGPAFKQVTIVQQDSQKDEVFTVTLGEVFISSYQLGGEQSDEAPEEEIGFSYQTICVADSVNGSKFCWDLRKGKQF